MSNDCDMCGNRPYINGAGGPCASCVDNSNWHNNREERHAASEQQIGGNHYKAMPIQPFNYITANGIGFAEGSVIKYVSRWRAKNGIEDLRKARHFLDLLIEHEEAQRP
jgi:hypothetical protein